ncbi:hypothetical protein Pmani_031242 [Petrolisthes manimaculis]|uniref:Uncharacterized protein n=1 Tax=Petrolisthes manimaculis TaxID=1843537 RepID=A0AAE1NW44_9EUCA|nr:hypothetical protein Pmani_031242 [Petrolisthes manimaculis]
MLTIEDIKTMLDMQQQAYRDAMEILMKDLSSRIRQVESSNSELIHSLQYTQKEVEDLKADKKTLIEEVTTLKKELCKKSEVEDKFVQLQSRVDYQEDYSRRNNLRFDGLDETLNETWEETQVKIQHLIRDKLEMGAVSTSPAASVMTVTPATTFAGGAASVGAVTGIGAVAVGEASAGVEDSQRGEGQEVAAQRKSKRKK